MQLGETFASLASGQRQLGAVGFLDHEAFFFLSRKMAQGLLSRRGGEAVASHKKCSHKARDPLCTPHRVMLDLPDFPSAGSWSYFL